MPIVTNMVPCKQKFLKKLDLALSVLTTHTNKTKQRDRKLLEVIEMFITMVLVTVSWVSTHIQINQVVSIKYVQFFCI